MAMNGATALPSSALGNAVLPVQPFSNLLVTLDVIGAQLDTMLEQQWSMIGAVLEVNMLSVSAGFQYTWSASAPIGSRVDAASIKRGGVTVVPTATYRITVNAFLADGGDGFAVRCRP